MEVEGISFPDINMYDKADRSHDGRPGLPGEHARASLARSSAAKSWPGRSQQRPVPEERRQYAQKQQSGILYAQHMLTCLPYAFTVTVHCIELLKLESASNSIGLATQSPICSS
jgi:hypothetical protein